MKTPKPPMTAPTVLFSEEERPQELRLACIEAESDLENWPD